MLGVQRGHYRHDDHVYCANIFLFTRLFLFYFGEVDEGGNNPGAPASACG